MKSHLFLFSMSDLRNHFKNSHVKSHEIIQIPRCYFTKCAICPNSHLKERSWKNQNKYWHILRTYREMVFFKHCLWDMILDLLYVHLTLLMLCKFFFIHTFFFTFSSDTAFDPNSFKPFFKRTRPFNIDTNFRIIRIKKVLLVLPCEVKFKG